jgi:hypothetical protein
MYTAALILSIISSILVIVYLVGLIFGPKKTDDEIKITISGRIVQVTTTTVVDEHGRVVEGQVVSAQDPASLPEENTRRLS